MTKLILFVLASYAAWYVFTTAELPLWGKLRAAVANRSATVAEFLLCPICSGFWCSAAVSLALPLFDVPSWMGEVGTWGVAPFVQGLAGAAAVYLIETHVTRLEER